VTTAPATWTSTGPDAATDVVGLGFATGPDVLVDAIGNDASVGGSGLRRSQNAPAHTMTVAMAAPTSRPRPNHSIQARARSPGVVGGAGLDSGSTIDLLDRQMRVAQRHQEEVGALTLSRRATLQTQWVVVGGWPAYFGGPEEAARQKAR
jgi:hypothetical protein